jgi:alpha-ketoglutarate-dependent taurine dioxygenase
MTAVTDTRLQVTPLSGWTGALITGVDLSSPLSPDEVTGIRDALHRWKVVFFRDQTLDHAAHIAFGAQFGDVTPGHPYEGDSAPAGFPQIHTVSPAAYDHRYGTRYRKKLSPNGPQWHADVTPLINPPSHSILRAETVPPYGGDTQFVNVAAVYQGLAPSVREFIDGLRAEHRFGATFSADRSNEKIGDLVRTNPLASIHPVVRVHPETGERVVYVNPSVTREIVDLSPRESRHILD